MRIPCLLSCFVLLALLTTAGSQEKSIPDERLFRSSWKNAGYPGDFPKPDLITNLLDHGGVADGQTDNSPAIEKAIQSLGGKPGVVLIPDGRFLFKKPIKPVSGTILRGHSPEKTTLVFDFVSHAVWISANQKGKFEPITNGYQLHSSKIAVSTASNFIAGDYIEIQQTNDPAWKTSSWAKNITGQINRVKEIRGDTIHLENSLRLEFDPALNPVIRKIEPITEVGIENLKVERLLAGEAKQRNNQLTIGFRYAARCRVRGVEGFNAFGGHVGAQHSTQLEVSGCYFHHAHEYDGGGSGYGVRLEMTTGDCLVEDNIFQSLRHSMLVQAGANGNVFAYNYSIESRRTEMPSEVSSDITLHGNYPFANLFEGNHCQHIWIDFSHGANGPLNTFFRNRAVRYGINMTDPLAHRQNFLGNETFTGKWSMFLGDGYSLKGEDHFEQANLTKAKGFQPEGSKELSTTSLYLQGKPRFWNIDTQFPSIGPPYEKDKSKTIPAKERFSIGESLTIFPQP